MVPLTVAVNCCVPFVYTDADRGAIATDTEAKFTAAEPFCRQSAWEIAAIVTVDGFGRAAGALYSPVEVMVPWVDSPPTVLFTLQVTPLFAVPLTVAENC